MYSGKNLEDTGYFQTNKIRKLVSAIAEKLRSSSLFWESDDDANALRQFGEAAVPTIAKLLNSSDTDIRNAAVVCLGRLDAIPGITIPALVKCLEDDNSDVSQTAFTYLNGTRTTKPITVGVKAKDAIPGLMEIIHANNSGHCREEAFSLLSKIGIPAIPLLIQLLQEDNAFNRRDAAVAIGNIGPMAKEALPSLIGMLRDDNKYLRNVATNVLGRLGVAAKSAVPNLIELLGDKTSGLHSGFQFLKDPLPETSWHFEDTYEEQRCKWTVQATAYEALKNVTSQDFGWLDQQAWRKWWESQSSFGNDG
ncbi:HEAT repeat domain-containing protein [Chloroflexota bacterium]